MLKDYIRALRVKHWIKNGLVLLPLLFSGQLMNPQKDLLGVLAFLSFSFLASAIYLINDLHDLEADRLHPSKRARPIAAGSISPLCAKVSASILIAIALLLSCSLSERPLPATLCLVIYAALNVAYSFGLKNYAVVDVTILSIGFLLRVLYGGYYCNITISSWLCMSVLALAFFFSLGKRRGEMQNHGTATRKSLKSYSVEFCDKCMYVFMALGLIFYSMWLFDRVSSMDELLLPVILAACVVIAIFACLRYCLIIESKECDGDPIEVLLSDKTLLISAIIWVIFMFVLLYFII